MPTTLDSGTQSTGEIMSNSLFPSEIKEEEGLLWRPRHDLPVRPADSSGQGALSHTDLSSVPCSTPRKRSAPGHKYCGSSRCCTPSMLAGEPKRVRVRVMTQSRQFLENWGELEKYCGYREDNIPQLEDINRSRRDTSHL